jgi:hypothetical protein
MGTRLTVAAAGGPLLQVSVPWPSSVVGVGLAASSFAPVRCTTTVQPIWPDGRLLVEAVTRRSLPRRSTTHGRTPILIGVPNTWPSAVKVSVAVPPLMRKVGAGGGRLEKYREAPDDGASPNLSTPGAFGWRHRKTALYSLVFGRRWRSAAAHWLAAGSS